MISGINANEFHTLRSPVVGNLVQREFKNVEKGLTGHYFVAISNLDTRSVKKTKHIRINSYHEHLLLSVISNTNAEHGEIS